MSIVITSITASILGLWLLVLSFRVIGIRARDKVSLGDGDGNSDLLWQTRAHGNFIEYAPIGVLLVLIAELQGLHSALLILGAALLVIGRLSHGLSFSFLNGQTLTRMVGMMASFISIGLLSLANLYLAIF